MARKASRTAAGGLGLPDGLSGEDLLDLYGTMVLVRALDERVWAMNRQGKAAIVASCQGHEAAQLGSVWAMRAGAPAHFSFTYYRDLAVLTAEGLTPTESLLGFLAKDGEPLSGARQFPQHGAMPKRHVINLSNVVATHVPHAVGWALAAKMRGEPIAVAAFFGDGASSQGEVHEAMNFAAVQKLPVVFICENNGYAISVPQASQMAVKHVSTRAEGYGMPGVTVDGTDVREVFQAVSAASRRAAAGEGPTLVELLVERYLPHTSDDDDSVYRERAEIEEARKRDPLAKLQALLLEAGLLTPQRDEQLRQRARDEVEAATDAAEAAPFPAPDDVFEHLFAPDAGQGGVR